MKRLLTIVLLLTILFLTLDPKGDERLRELQSADGYIRIEVFDPGECDEIRVPYVRFAGSAGDSWLNGQFGLGSYRCGYKYDANDVVLIEAPGWLAIASRASISQKDEEPENSISVIIDRRKKLWYGVTPWSIPECALWPEILASVKAIRSRTTPRR